eukprot:TRINITY_DN7522_c2_g1_i1.p2 TRINITY_DN7522_c2_g1~~TRINITY_DN7522_c2_g1_i1.p2  ORF type:complete len:182 (-),score=17.11 TRINITY_DN7522_c2_g1_i1:8-496(-)
MRRKRFSRSPDRYYHSRASDRKRNCYDDTPEWYSESRSSHRDRSDNDRRYDRRRNDRRSYDRRRNDRGRYDRGRNDYHSGYKSSRGYFPANKSSYKSNTDNSNKPPYYDEEDQKLRDENQHLVQNREKIQKVKTIERVLHEDAPRKKYSAREVRHSAVFAAM